MKLLYLWVFDHWLFRCREFNFCDEYHFSFNYEIKCLECNRNYAYPSKFYKSANVELISYIIGDNGNGKTTLLNLLMELLSYKGGIALGDGEHYLKFIYVLQEEASCKICIYSTLDKIEIKAQKDIILKNCRDNIITKMECNEGGFFACQEMKDTAIIFHSNVFDRNRYNKPNGLYGVEDISFNGLLWKDFEYRTTNLKSDAKTQLRVFLDSEMIRQIKFISENVDKELEEWIPFPLPQKLYICFKDEYDMLSSVYLYDNPAVHIDNENTFYEYDKEMGINIINLKSLRKIASHISRDIIKKYDSLYKQSSVEFQYLLNKGILMSYLRLIFPETVGMGTSKQFQNLILGLRKFMRSSNFDLCVEFIEKLIEIVDIDPNELSSAVVKINDFARNMGDHGIKSQFSTFYFLASCNEKSMTDFYMLFRATTFGADYLSFQWDGLSSGEYNLLNMYSRIYSLCNKVKDQKAIILMIDEADLSYHPKWQQKFMKSLVSFLNKFYSKQHIQIIVATHSPIMLSDALMGNVVFLNRESGKDLENTFGANIYDLYRDGMFLEKDGLGIIGTYAADKIRDVMKKLDDWKEGEILEDLEEIKNLIACIGEPIIKRIMQNKFEVKEQNVKGKDKHTMMVSAMIEKLNELQPEELAEVMERIQKK